MLDDGENESTQRTEKVGKMMVVDRTAKINGKLNSELGKGFGYRVGQRVFPYLFIFPTPLQYRDLAASWADETIEEVCTCLLAGLVAVVSCSAVVTARGVRCRGPQRSPFMVG